MAEPTEAEKKLAEGFPELEAALDRKTEPLPRFGFDDLPGDEGTELQEALRILSEERGLITEISQSDFFGLPVSKAWRKQTDIARSGAAGYDLNVGNKTRAGELFIEATISDKDGNPLEIDELEKQVQRAIGNLVDEARRLPIAVTPRQIYRAYARLPADATVTEQQAAEMEAAMDKLLTAPGTINYKNSSRSTSR